MNKLSGVILSAAARKLLDRRKKMEKHANLDALAKDLATRKLNITHAVLKARTGKGLKLTPEEFAKHVEKAKSFLSNQADPKSIVYSVATPEEVLRAG